MKRIIGAGVAGLAVLGAVAAGAGSAFAAPPPQSGNVTGTVTVETALTLQLTNTSFNIANALPGVSDNGVPPIGVKISTNDSGGYALSTYMDDVAPLPGNACNTWAFQQTSGAPFIIPDSAWSDTSTGGPGAVGTVTYSGYTGGALENGGGGCLPAAPQAVTVGSNSGESGAAGDSFVEQLAVTVPADTPGGAGVYNGSLTFLATGA